MRIDQKNKKDRQKLGAFLLSLRNYLGLTLKEAAERAEMSFTYLSQIERGERVPSRDVIANLARAYSTDEQAILREAGYLDMPVTDVSPARVNWAFATVCRDCDYRYGLRAWMTPLDLVTKALITEIYQGYTGRQLLTESEEEGVHDLLESEPRLSPEIEDEAWSKFMGSVHLAHGTWPELSPSDVARSLLFNLARRAAQQWDNQRWDNQQWGTQKAVSQRTTGKQPELAPGLDPQAWNIESTEVDFSEMETETKTKIEKQNTASKTAVAKSTNEAKQYGERG